MGIRLKVFLIFFLLGLAPMFVLSAFAYFSGLRSVESVLRSEVERDTAGLVYEIEEDLREREAGLSSLARSTALRDYVRGDAARTISFSNSSESGLPQKSNLMSGTVPIEVQADIRAFFFNNPKRYTSLTCFNAARRTMFRAELVSRTAKETEVQFQTADFLSNSAVFDQNVWTTAEQTLMRSPIVKESLGATLRYTIPVFTGEAGTPAPRGALIAELKVDELFEEAMTGRNDEGQASGTGRNSSLSRVTILLDRAGQMLYHTNVAHRHQSSKQMPGFDHISKDMLADRSGWAFYETQNASWLVTYRPITSLGLSVAVGGNYSAAVRDVERLGWIGLIFFILFGLATIAALTLVVRRAARSIERVTEGAVAIAGGKLDQRIEVRSSDETHLLAESFNIMTNKLREQFAREAESRQFESFMRLSAMLTHDLKNAIAGLSLLVGNMERQFHRAEFRADAMSSLTDATDKLRKLVAKLSEPIKSLSSEHQMPRPTDLVLIIRRVIDATVEPVRSFHQVEIELPETLIATVETERMEKVFENLVINAIEAMEGKSGKLIIEAGPMAEGKVFFRVSDTGPGMSEEFQRTKLYRPFATTKKRGVGLGLYTCREIVNAHGGQIEVESRRGSGATFRIVLPSEQKITGRT